MILHREDTKDLNIPLFIESFPEKFLDSRVFARIREEAFLVPEGLRKPIEIPKSYTASDEEIEHKLWYFREDVGINCKFGIINYLSILLFHTTMSWSKVLVSPQFFSSIIDCKFKNEQFYYSINK